MLKVCGYRESYEENYDGDDDDDDDGGPDCKDDYGGDDDDGGADDDDDDHLSVNGHTEIPDKGSGSTSWSAPWRCQVQRTLMMKLILRI